MSHDRTLSEVSEEYFHQRPEEIDSFISRIFEEYAEDGDTAALLSSLRVISRVNGNPPALNRQSSSNTPSGA